jgi:uncharacterized MAPEG superfamily protein
VIIAVILAHVLTATQQVGLSVLAGNRDNFVLTGLAGRLERATNNSLFAFALVSPAALMINLSDPANISADQLLLTFLIARIAYVALYAFGIAWLRTAAWVTAFMCTALLYVELVL